MLGACWVLTVLSVVFSYKIHTQWDCWSPHFHMLLPLSFLLLLPSISSFFLPFFYIDVFLFECMFYISTQWILGSSLVSFLSCFFMVYNANWGCQYNAAKLMDGNGFFCNFPKNLGCTLNLGWVTSHLFGTAVRSTAICPSRWAWMISEPPVWLSHHRSL